MTSKAERKRRRRAKRAKVITLPNGASVSSPMVPGQHKPKEDPLRVVIDVRRRLMGDAADKVDLRSPIAGDALGRALLLADFSAKEDRKIAVVQSDGTRVPKSESPLQGAFSAPYGLSVLWDAVSHIRRTFAAYDRACGAPMRHPKCLNVLTPPDHLEATAESPPWDDRPEAERDRAAVSAYMAVQGWLDYCDRAARSACLRAVVDDTGVSDLPGIVLALQCVADGRAGRKIEWRGR